MIGKKSYDKGQFHIHIIGKCTNNEEFEKYNFNLDDAADFAAEAMGKGTIVIYKSYSEAIDDSEVLMYD